MTDIQWEILDQVYFMNSYQTVRENVTATNEGFDNALVELLRNGLVRQLVYSEARVDIVDVDPFDATRFEKSQFVITKQGLLLHTGAV